MQPVNVDIRISSPEEPPGCLSDQLADVVCYEIVVERVAEAIKNRSFRLIESMAACMFKEIVPHIPLHNGVVEITVTKPKHPVPLVHGGIAFTYRRRLSQKHS